MPVLSGRLKSKVSGGDGSVVGGGRKNLFVLDGCGEATDFVASIVEVGS